MNIDEARAIMTAAATVSGPKPQVLPATVLNRKDTLCSVLLDGDPAGSVTDCETLVPDVHVGDRVMILFDPPRGVFIVGTARRAIGAGMLAAYGERTTNLSLTTSNQDALTVGLQAVANRRYRVDAWAYGIEAISSGVNGWLLNLTDINNNNLRTGFGAGTQLNLGSSISLSYIYDAFETGLVEFKLRMRVSNVGTATLSVTGADRYPFIAIYDIGPVPARVE